MSITNTPLRSALLIVSVVFSAQLAADPAADYEAGRRAYLTDQLPDAMASLEKAAGAGHAPAQALLAHIMDAAEENELAVSLYQKAAYQGNAEGQLGLSNMYAIGEGVARNEQEALRYLKLSAEQGFAPAMLRLGELYLDGGLGLEKDESQGQQWIERAAESGYAPAKGRLESLANKQGAQ